MEEENKTNFTPVVIGVIIVAIIGLLIWGFFFKSPKEVLAPNDEVITKINTPAKTLTIDVKHQYKNGTHLYGGLVNLPSPCYSLGSVISINSAAVNITLNSTNSDNTCAQVITPTYFKVSVTGPAKVTLKGTLDGKPVQFNIFEIGANEDFDSADIYYKG